MEEDIKRVEEMVEVYHSCADNEDDYDMRVDIGFMKKDAQALENLIKGYRQLEENHINPSKARISYYDTKKGTEVVIEGFIPKSKIKEKIEELKERNKTGYAKLQESKRCKLETSNTKKHGSKN